MLASVVLALSGAIAHSAPLPPITAGGCSLKAEIESRLDDQSGLFATGTSTCYAEGRIVSQTPMKVGIIGDNLDENMIGLEVTITKPLDGEYPSEIPYTFENASLTLVVNTIEDNELTDVIQVRAGRGRAGAYRGGYRGRAAYRGGAYVRRGAVVGGAAAGAAIAAPYYGGCDPNYQDCGSYGGGGYYRGGAVVRRGGAVYRGGAAYRRGGAYRGGRGAHVAHHRGGRGRR